MSDFLGKFKIVLGSSLTVLYRVLAIFGLVEKDDTTGDDLKGAFGDFLDGVKDVF